MSKAGFGTFCLHGYKNLTRNESHILPIYPSSSFVFESLEDSIAVFTGKSEGHVYSRYGNPTVETVAQKIADLESYGQEEKAWGLLTSSGMSAIYVLLQSLLKPDRGLLCPLQLYGGTTELFRKVLEPHGINIHTADFSDLQFLDEYLSHHSDIEVIYLETPTNPTLLCFDLSHIIQIAKKRAIKVVVDNTFPTPYLQQPLLQGADYVIHSTTKYLNGHGNSIAGIIIGHKGDNNYHQIWQNLKLIGANCSPFEAWMVYNGLKTLELRMERHSANALAIAGFLERHVLIERVNYPGLESHATHQIAKKQMKNGFGGMLSLELKTDDLLTVAKFMNNLNLATQAPTLGDTDTLIMHPYTSSHLKVDEEQKKKEGVNINLVRFSIGIENVHDLIDDLNQALNKIK
jgi:methionine-gamma-lyase